VAGAAPIEDVRVEAVELRRVALPLVEPFRTAHGTTTVRDLVLVRVRTSAGDGWAECAAQPTPTYTSEWTAGAHALLRDHLVPQVLGVAVAGTDPGAGAAGASGAAAGPRWAHVGAAVATALDDVVGHPMAKAALEAACLDAALHAAGVALAADLGATASTVPLGVVLGITASVDALVASACARVDAGYGRLKVKVRPGWDAEPLGAVRAAVGPDVVLVADANGAYRLDDADDLAALDRLGLAAIEQPLAADRLLDHVALARRIGTPIALDESLGSEADVEAALALGACRAVCLKPARVGGLAAARRVHDRCVDAGVDLWVGGMLETGVGRGAVLAIAALPGCTHPGDVAAPGRWYRPDLVEGVGLGPDGGAPPGRLVVPREPGCTPPPDPAVLVAATTAVDEIR
jgi:o-succinylbenzoate synthase